MGAHFSVVVLAFFRFALTVGQHMGLYPFVGGGIGCSLQDVALLEIKDVAIKRHAGQGVDTVQVRVNDF